MCCSIFSATWRPPGHWKHQRRRKGEEQRAEGEAGGKPEELGMGLDGGAEPQASRARLASPSLSFLAFDQLGIHSGYI